MDAGVEHLLTHPAIWRGSRAAPLATVPSGFAALDACLPGRGWPRAGLIEILHERTGQGEISLLLPALAALLRPAQARGCAWVAPAGLDARAGRGGDGGVPLEPYAPALAAAGVTLERVLVVRPDARLGTAALWAFGQALRSGACEVALAWLEPHMLELRRLQAAAGRGRTLGILFRHVSAAASPSAATLRVRVECAPPEAGAGPRLRVTILKSRGGFRGQLDLPLNPHMG